MNKLGEVEQCLLNLGFECQSVPTSEKKLYVKDSVSVLISKRGA